MTALAANKVIKRIGDETLREFAVEASAHIYEGAFVGIHPVTGYARPFEPCDLFAGTARNEANNTTGAAGSLLSGATTTGVVMVEVAGLLVHALTGVSLYDVGRAVYATDDNVLSFTGHPDGFVGRVIHKDAANVAVVQLRRPFERPNAGDTGSKEQIFDGSKLITPTGAVAGPKYGQGHVLQSSLGLGVYNSVAYASLQFDAVAEIAQASVETDAVFDIANGITFDADLYINGIGDHAALDFDWGLANVLDATTRADLDDGTLTKHCRFHMDGAVANILAESDDNGTDVAAVDTTIDNDTATSKNFIILARKTGVCELYIEKARVLAATAFGIGSASALFAGFVNLEKISNDTVAVARLLRMRTAGA
ncbi:MAG TPA: hypothetical protein ENI79_02130 [Rhodospirillales bacterium]|nr:hypothetical protein [Rhodospirillales bacterium]